MRHAARRKEAQRLRSQAWQMLLEGPKRGRTAVRRAEQRSAPRLLRSKFRSVWKQLFSSLNSPPWEKLCAGEHAVNGTGDALVYTFAAEFLAAAQGERCAAVTKASRNNFVFCAPSGRYETPAVWPVASAGWWNIFAVAGCHRWSSKNSDRWLCFDKIIFPGCHFLGLFYVDFGARIRSYGPPREGEPHSSPCEPQHVTFPPSCG